MSIVTLRPEGVRTEDFLGHLATSDAVDSTMLALAQFIETNGEMTLKQLMDRFPELGRNRIKIAMFDLCALGFAAVAA